MITIQYSNTVQYSVDLKSIIQNHFAAYTMNELTSLSYHQHQMAYKNFNRDSTISNLFYFYLSMCGFERVLSLTIFIKKVIA